MSAVRRLTLAAGAERLRNASPAHAPLVEAIKAGVTLLRIWPGLRFARYKTGFAVADRKGGLPLVYCHAGGCSRQDLIEALLKNRTMAGRE